MAALVWDQVVDIAPELGGVVVRPNVRAAILEAVDLQVAESTWGTRYDLGRKYLAAHLAVEFLGHVCEGRHWIAAQEARRGP